MTPAHLFWKLMYAWSRDCADMSADIYAADLAALVGREGRTCVALLKKDAVPSLFGLTFFLDGYGLALRQRYRQQGDGVFIWLEPQEERASQFVGTVEERRAA